MQQIQKQQYSDIYTESIIPSPQKEKFHNKKQRPSSSDKYQDLGKTDQIFEENEDDILNPRNFLANLYQDDNFMKIKEKMTEDLIMSLKQNVMKEQQDLMCDVDQQLKELERWKKTKKDQQNKFKLEEQELLRLQDEEQSKIRMQLIEDDENEIDREFQIQLQRMRDGEKTMNVLKLKDNAGVQAKEIINQQMHTKINEKLMSKEKQIQDIQEQIHKKNANVSQSSVQKLEQIMDKSNPSKLNLAPSTNDSTNYTNRTSMDERWVQNEKIMKQFVEFEEQALKFDEELNAMLMGDTQLNSQNKSASDQQVTDEEIQRLLKQIKENDKLFQSKQSSQQKSSQNFQELEDEKIANILDDIENEFQELDDLLKEVDTYSSSIREQEEFKLEMINGGSHKRYAPSD
eukprot:403331081